MDNKINLLVTLDDNYMPRLQVLLTSLRINNPGESFEIWLIHSGISDSWLDKTDKQCGLFGFQFSPLKIDPSYFENAPVTRQYPQEMYYRLLAPHLLPDSVHRILYLDPDTLVINPLRPLWETDMQGNIFAAAAHTGKTELANNINQVRLGTDHPYFNSGVLLMDLDQGRHEIIPEDVFRYAEEHAGELLLPDQDMLNAMYGSRTLEIDDFLWNYDARNYNNYLLRSTGVCNMDQVMARTAILHFCGRSKPWQDGYIHRFGILYKHYIQLTERILSRSQAL
ncbi:MAG TPA: glycosyltransferase family 8 protein [Candidatus Mediterraneibacter stercoripullorum]|nr:glycosyltransferase family 8 protein [Candidatus Mediterraneibacter stercoripullorum]